MEGAALPLVWGAGAANCSAFEQRYRPLLAPLRARARRLARAACATPALRPPHTETEAARQLVLALRISVNELAASYPQPETHPTSQVELQTQLDLLVDTRARLLRERQLFVDEVKNKYSAYLFAKDYYKTHLKMYYTIENGPELDDVAIYIQFFTSKKLKSNDYSVTMSKKRSEESYRLTETNPHLSIHNQLQDRLKQTGDVIGLICCIRRCFIQVYQKTLIH